MISGFFVINQMPGSTTYNIVSYYMTSTPIKDIPLLEKFLHGDDTFRNSRFKLIPIITKASIVSFYVYQRWQNVGWVDPKHLLSKILKFLFGCFI